MHKLKILNSKEVKEILKRIEAQWGAKLKLDYAFLKNQKNRVFIVNKGISEIDFSKLKVNSLGMYFCEIDRLGIRLSIEGSQIAGPKSAKNIVEITEEQAKKWLSGQDLGLCQETKGSYSGFVIIKHNNDFFGTGRYQDGKVLNYVSKSRRINSQI
ncbi:hypothetical protein KY347_01515 [Candidatus Woesearchaeota archaeon]|nr:hypothetical protein [Candidatus Woesearchaeota archaeon]